MYILTYKSHKIRPSIIHGKRINYILSNLVVVEQTQSDIISLVAHLFLYI